MTFISRIEYYVNCFIIVSFPLDTKKIYNIWNPIIFVSRDFPFRFSWERERKWVREYEKVFPFSMCAFFLAFNLGWAFTITFFNIILSEECVKCQKVSILQTFKICITWTNNEQRNFYRRSEWMSVKLKHNLFKFRIVCKCVISLLCTLQLQWLYEWNKMKNISEQNVIKTQKKRKEKWT